MMQEPAIVIIAPSSDSLAISFQVLSVLSEMFSE